MPTEVQVPEKTLRAQILNIFYGGHQHGIQSSHFVLSLINLFTYLFPKSPFAKSLNLLVNSLPLYLTLFLYFLPDVLPLSHSLSLFCFISLAPLHLFLLRLCARNHAWMSTRNLIWCQGWIGPQSVTSKANTIPKWLSFLIILLFSSFPLPYSLSLYFSFNTWYVSFL